MGRIQTRDVCKPSLYSGGSRSRLLHSPIRPGPLHHLPFGDGTIADTFRSSTYYAYRSEFAMTLYRVQANPWNEGDCIPGFWTANRPASSIQAILDTALDPSWGNSGTHWIELIVPAGTQIFEGLVAAQRGLVGGGSQIFLLDTENVSVKRQQTFADSRLVKRAI